MPVPHVQRLEVVPVGLDLGAFGDLEAEADERVLEPFPGLGDEVGVAARRCADELGEVESLAFDPSVERLAAERRRGELSSAAATAAIASLIACPADFLSSIESSEPSRVFSWARSPFLPVSAEVSSLTSSSVVADVDRGECRVTGGGDVGEHVDGLSDAVSVVECHPPVSPGARKSLQLRLHGANPIRSVADRRRAEPYRYGADMRLERSVRSTAGGAGSATSPSIPTCR